MTLNERPFQTKFSSSHRPPQSLGGRRRTIRLAALQQHGEFIAAKAGQQMCPGADVFFSVGDLPQQMIAGSMAAGVVDDLELIEIEEHQRMRPRIGVDPRQCVLDPTLEFAAVRQPRQCIMRGLERET